MEVSMRLIDEVEHHLIFEIGKNPTKKTICVPIDNPRAAFEAESPAHARARVLDAARAIYVSAMLS